jgi:hypothetical protein
VKHGRGFHAPRPPPAAAHYSRGEETNVHETPIDLPRPPTSDVSVLASIISDLGKGMDELEDSIAALETLSCQTSHPATQRSPLRIALRRPTRD